MSELNDLQKEVIAKLDLAMKQLFGVFVEVDASGLEITEALEHIGMDVPLFAKPAVNQLSGRLKEVRENLAVNAE